MGRHRVNRVGLWSSRARPLKTNNRIFSILLCASAHPRGAELDLSLHSTGCWRASCQSRECSCISSQRPRVRSRIKRREAGWAHRDHSGSQAGWVGAITDIIPQEPLRSPALGEFRLFRLMTRRAVRRPRRRILLKIGRRSHHQKALVSAKRDRDHVTRNHIPRANTGVGPRSRRRRMTW